MIDLLHLYTWILISILILITGAIGFFYQKKFNIKTNYNIFILSAVLTLSVVLNGGELLNIYIVGFINVELIELSGILFASFLSLKLFRAMTGAM